MFIAQNLMQLENYLACWTFGIDSFFFFQTFFFSLEMCIIPFKISDDLKIDDLKKKRNWNWWTFCTTHLNKFGSNVFLTFKFMNFWGCRFRSSGWVQNMEWRCVLKQFYTYFWSCFLYILKGWVPLFCACWWVSVMWLKLKHPYLTIKSTLNTFRIGLNREVLEKCWVILMKIPFPMDNLQGQSWSFSLAHKPDW
jgi:hypothetical protein